MAGLDEDSFAVSPNSSLMKFIERKRSERGSQSGEPLAAALVISGDLVDKGLWKDAKAAQGFIEMIRKGLGLPKKRVLVVPGNHDVDWSAALSEPLRSRSEFSAATKGYVVPKNHAKAIVLQESGLAFLLVDTVQYVGVPVNLDKVVDAVHSAIPQLDRRQLIEAVKRGVATEVPSIGPGAVEKALKTIRRRAGSSVLPPDLLGFLVSHYPLLPCPYTNVEFRPFEIPVGAGPTKRVLAENGIYVCLHGHQHSHWVHSEKTQGGSPDVRFVCVGAGSLTQGDRGFNIIKYALMTETGEARIAVQPIVLQHADTIEAPARRFHIPPRTGVPARSIRLVERIEQDGSVRGDKWFSDISTAGWNFNVSTNRFELDVPIVIHLDQSGAPLDLSFQELTPGFSLEWKPQKDGGVPGSLGMIRISAKKDTSRLSFAYREWSRLAYCRSIMEKARCFGGDPVVPGLKYDEEALVHVVRFPCERLEIYVRTPDEAPALENVRFVTFRELENGSLEPEEAFAELTDFTIETWPEAKRMRLIVPRPLANAAYGLAWRVPLHTKRDKHHGEKPSEPGDVKLTERLRAKLFSARDDAAVFAQLETPWKTLVREIEDLIAGMSEEVAAGPWELALLVSDQEILAVTDYQERALSVSLRDPARLWPVLATFGRDDKRYNAEVSVGEGIAGHSFATNAPIWFDARNGEPTRASVKGGRTMPRVAPSPYVDVTVGGTRLARHSMLVAFPAALPEAGAIPLGCLCIGSFNGALPNKLGLDDSLLSYLQKFLASV